MATLNQYHIEQSQIYQGWAGVAMRKAVELGVAPSLREDYWVRQEELAEAYAKNHLEKGGEKP